MTSLSIFERATVVIHSVTTLNLYCADYVENKIQFNSKMVLGGFLYICNNNYALVCSFLLVGLCTPVQYYGIKDTAKYTFFRAT